MLDFIHFSLAHTDMTAFRIFVLIDMVMLWVLGVKAVTSQGKIFHFVQDFFETTVDRKSYQDQKGNEHMDKLMLQALPVDFKEHVRNNVWLDTYLIIIENIIESDKTYSDDDTIVLLYNLVQDVPNKYWRYTKVRRMSDKIVDPVIGCPTCMPSLHTAIIYTTVVVLKGWHWNPLVWGFVAISATYFTEQFWKTRNILDRIIKLLDQKIKS